MTAGRAEPQAAITYRASRNGRRPPHGLRAATFAVALAVLGAPTLAASSASPGTALLVFAGSRGEATRITPETMADLYAMPPTGGDVRRLTRTPLSEDQPAWSADGRTIAFRVGETTCHAGACDVVLWSGISVVSASGGAPRRLTGGPELDQFDASPSWSPDGRIAFTRTSAGGAPGEGIWVVDGDRRSRRLVAGKALAVDWSPDGARLVYVLEIATLTGTNRVRVVDLRTGRGRTLRARGLRGVAFRAVWAPDGRALAVETSSGVFVVPADGGRARRLAPEGFGQPVWEPRGRRLAIVGFRSGSASQIYLVRRDGTGLRRITSDAHSYSSPDWR